MVKTFRAFFDKLQKGYTMYKDRWEICGLCNTTFDKDQFNYDLRHYDLQKNRLTTSICSDKIFNFKFCP